MKLKYVLPAIGIASLLTACGSTAHTTAESPKPSSATASATDEALKLTSDWDELDSGKTDSSEYVLPSKRTEHFSEEQVDKVASDAVELLQNQLKYQSAESQHDVLNDVDAFISEAPGKMADYMRTTSKEDASDKNKPVWPLIYVQPIDSTYKVEDTSRSTYAWDVKEQELHGTDGVTVSLFHRSFYTVQSSNGDENSLLVARWLELSTIDPDYAATSGDYAWRLEASMRGAEICDAVERSLLVPTPNAEPLDEDFEALLKVDPSDYRPKHDFEANEKGLAEAAEKC